MAKRKSPDPPVSIGEKFGRWTIESKSYRRAGKLYFVADCICECGTRRQVVTASLHSGKSKSCGCLHLELLRGPKPERQREKSYLWNGGRVKDRRGYMLMYLKGHHLATPNGYVIEHRYIMEQMIGRRLLPGETVHHKNGIRDDNRPENLELWDRKHGAGVRSADKLDFFKSEILAKDTTAGLRILRDRIDAALALQSIAA